jgi:modulator of FtsH protease HflK
MSQEHEHHHHDHGHEPHASAPEAQDAGSQALAEALRSSFAVVKIVMVLMVVAFFASGFFQVGPSEKAVILRFGKPLGEGSKALLTSGLHWSLPYPIDEVVKIPITEIQKVSSTVGWYFTTPEQELSGEEIPAGQSLNPAFDGYALTSDRNIIHTRATLSYHIDDPIKYVFDFASASNTVQNLLNNALLYTAAHYKVDDAIYSDVAGFQDAVRQRVSELTDEQKLGIAIDQCQVQSLPPRQLTEIFAQVTTARENRTKALYDAHNYENTNLLAASSTAFSITNQAEAARKIYVSYMDALATNFVVLLPQYQRDPVLFERQQLGDVMAVAFTNLQRKIFMPQRADGKPRELRLMESDEPPQPKTQASP